MLDRAYALINLASSEAERLLMQTNLDLVIENVKSFITLERDHNSTATEETDDAP